MNSKFISSIVWLYIIGHLTEICYNIFLINSVYNEFIIGKYMIFIQSLQIIFFIIFVISEQIVKRQVMAKNHMTEEEFEEQRVRIERIMVAGNVEPNQNW